MERDERLEILSALPKLDLHRHLEGSLRLTTLLELGRKNGVSLPLQNAESLAPLVTYQEGEPRTLQHFLTKFHAEWYRSYADVERVAGEIVADAAREGVIYLELRFSPEHLTRHNRLQAEGVMEAVAEAAGGAAADNDIEVRFLLTFTRERYDLDRWKRAVDFAVSRSDRGFVGVDLAGDEFAHANDKFARFFERVRDTGVLSATIHAGEGTSAAQVQSAVERLFARRIGHGLSSAEDPAVMELLARRGVALEMCPISNYQTGCIDGLEQHPLPALDRAGVPVTLNSDDPAIHGSTLNDEYDAAVTSWGYGLADLLRLEQNAVQAAFVDEETREHLRDRVERGYREAQGQGLA